MTPRGEARLHRVIARASLAVLAVGIGAGTADWTWYPTAEAAPATKTVAWLTDVRPGVTTPTNAGDVTWPQTLDTGECGDGWVQVDTYRYATPTDRAVVDRLVAAGTLQAPGRVGGDSDVIVSWTFRPRTPCTPTPEPSSTTDAPSPTPTDTTGSTPSISPPPSSSPSTSASTSPSAPSDTSSSVSTKLPVVVPAGDTTASGPASTTAGTGPVSVPSSVPVAAGDTLANTGIPLWGWLLIGLGVLGLGAGTLAAAAVLGGADDRFDVFPDEGDHEAWLAALRDGAEE